jgi:predicted alpha-1,6-mannanase (GH76 family)
MRVYWDSERRYFYRYSDHTRHESAAGPEDGTYTDYWWEAQIWEMVMDVYEATHEVQHLGLVEAIFDGFTSAYPDFSANDWNDDIGWWARGCVRAYELTGNPRYLASAQAMFDYIYSFHDDLYGGGIWWKNVDVGDGAKNEKNVATNATAVYTAMRLYRATQEPSYKEDAIEILSWLRANFFNDGHVLDHVNGQGAGTYVQWDWTYNNGGYAGACLEMYLDLMEPNYLHEAVRAVDWAVKNMTREGVFLDEGTGDSGGFKAILTRNMWALVKAGGQEQYQQVLANNALQAAIHANSDGIVGYDWASAAPELQREPVQSLAAAAAVAVLHHAPRDWPVSL